MNNSLTENIYFQLADELYCDIANDASLPSDESRKDRRTMRLRFQEEGVSFYTKTLPKLGKALDRALSSDEPLSVRGFALRNSSCIPRFIGCLLERIFDDSGHLLKTAEPSIVKHCRQLCYLWYKVELPYAETDIRSVLEGFVSVDSSLPQEIAGEGFEGRVLKIARKQLSQLFSGFDPKEITPRHGPGAVATGEDTFEKSKFSRLYRDLDSVYPFDEYMMYNLTHVCDQPGYLDSLVSLDTGTAKVVLVPKDSRGPRLISCEPLEYQWIQQGLSRKMVSHIENHPMTAGHVNFTDQGVNRNLALASSKDGRWVTLDMKEASDRVSLCLVEELFKGTPLLDALLASRTKFTKLPSGELVKMKKFAPMGSALCFPVESLCFYFLASACVSASANVPLRVARRSVYVYGDDLIIRKEVYQSVLQWLPAFGLMFNDGKCCTAGLFRESCGMDAFNGTPVTPLKIRTVWDHRKSPEQLVSYVEYSNSLYEKGYYRSAAYLEDITIKRYGSIPYKDVNNAPYIGFLRSGVSARLHNQRAFKHRRNPNLQRYEICSRIIKPVYKTQPYDSWRELLRRYSDGGTQTELGRRAIVRRTRLVRTWTACFYE
jgi:hypothetical protein